MQQRLTRRYWLPGTAEKGVVHNTLPYSIVVAAAVLLLLVLLLLLMLCCCVVVVAVVVLFLVIVVVGMLPLKPRSASSRLHARACVFFTFHRYFHPAISREQPESVPIPDPGEMQVVWSHNVRDRDTTLYDKYDIHVLWSIDTKKSNYLKNNKGQETPTYVFKSKRKREKVEKNMSRPPSRHVCGRHLKTTWKRREAVHIPHTNTARRRTMGNDWHWQKHHIERKFVVRRLARLSVLFLVDLIACNPVYRLRLAFVNYCTVYPTLGEDGLDDTKQPRQARHPTTTRQYTHFIVKRTRI